VIIKLSDNDNLTIDFCKGFKHLYKQLEKYNNNKINMCLLRYNERQLLITPSNIKRKPRIVKLCSMLEQTGEDIHTYKVSLPDVSSQIVLTKNDAWSSYFLSILLLNSNINYYDDKIFIGENTTLPLSNFIAMTKLTTEGIKSTNREETFIRYMIGNNIVLIYNILNNGDKGRYNIDTHNFIVN